MISLDTAWYHMISDTIRCYQIFFSFFEVQFLTFNLVYFEIICKKLNESFPKYFANLSQKLQSLTVWNILRTQFHKFKVIHNKPINTVNACAPM